jgi:hypothetical protein
MRPPYNGKAMIVAECRGLSARWFRHLGPNNLFKFVIARRDYRRAGRPPYPRAALGQAVSMAVVIYC